MDKSSKMDTISMIAVVTLLTPIVSLLTHSGSCYHICILFLLLCISQGPSIADSSITVPEDVTKSRDDLTLLTTPFRCDGWKVSSNATHSRYQMAHSYNKISIINTLISSTKIINMKTKCSACQCTEVKTYITIVNGKERVVEVRCKSCNSVIEIRTISTQ